MKKYFATGTFLNFLLLLFLIINISISGISNTSGSSLIMKLFSSTVLLSLLYANLRLSNNSLKNFINSSQLRRILLIVLIVILYLILTLTYSTNILYGAQKITNIVVSVIPNIIATYFLISFLRNRIIKNYLSLIIITGIILTLIAIFIFNPFDRSTIYQFSSGRWSHVFVGRTISFLTLIAFLYLINTKENNKILLYAFAFIAGLYVTYLTGLRSAAIGLVICSLIIAFWYLFKRKLVQLHLYIFFVIIFLIPLLVLITPEKFSTSSRFENMVKIEKLEFGGDGPILSRIDSYNLSWQMFKDKPVIGWGLGSFNGYNKIEWTSIQKYPHNLILEILAELGVTGFIFFSAIFYYIMRGILNSKILYNGGEAEFLIPVSSVIILFFFSIWLAMWAKDISTQGFLWLFFVFAGDKNKDKYFSK